MNSSLTSQGTPPPPTRDRDFSRLRTSPYRTVLCLFLALVSFSCTTRADLVLEQKIEGDMQNGSVTLKFKDRKIRVDLGNQISTITDADSAEVLTLMHAERKFTRTSPAAVRAALEQPAADPTATPQPRPQPASTGRQEKIGETPCEVFTWAYGSFTATYWVAKDHPALDLVRKALLPLESSALGALGSHLLPRVGDLSGLPLKSDIHLDKIHVVTEFVSAKEESLPPNLFEVPKNYSETSATP